jgi:hypothetical protein
MYVEHTFDGLDVNGPIMLAMHPHGTTGGRGGVWTRKMHGRADARGPVTPSFPGIFCMGFICNGAARIHARCVRKALRESCTAYRMIRAAAPLRAVHHRKPEVYLPPNYQNMSTKSTGVAEPLLFKIPLIKVSDGGPRSLFTSVHDVRLWQPFLEFFGCAEPASKKIMHDIFSRKVTVTSGVPSHGASQFLMLPCMTPGAVWHPTRRL